MVGSGRRHGPIVPTSRTAGHHPPGNPDRLRHRNRGMSFQVDEYAKSIVPVRWDDLDLDNFRREPLSGDALRCLRYMSDVETHTVCYLRDLLVTPSHADPEITKFLTMWNFEEYWHGEVLDEVLEVHGVPTGPEHTMALRKRMGWRDRLAPIRQAVHRQRRRQRLHRDPHDLGRDQRVVHALRLLPVRRLGVAPGADRDPQADRQAGDPAHRVLQLPGPRAAGPLQEGAADHPVRPRAVLGHRRLRRDARSPRSSTCSATSTAAPTAWPRPAGSTPRSTRCPASTACTWSSASSRSTASPPDPPAVAVLRKPISARSGRETAGRARWQSRALVDDAAGLADGALDAAGLDHPHGGGDADPVLDPAGQLGRQTGVRRGRHVLARPRPRPRARPAGPGRVSTHWKYGVSPGSASTSSSTWVGKTLTPRTIIRSSVRPVTFAIRRIPGRAVPGSSRVRSRVR